MYFLSPIPSMSDLVIVSLLALFKTSPAVTTFLLGCAGCTQLAGLQRGITQECWVYIQLCQASP